jgi:hypothetical protein
MPNQQELGKFVDDGRGNYPGECVSLVKRLCPQLPSTGLWKQGRQVRDILAKGEAVLPGTAIATFNSKGKFDGHAAVYYFWIPIEIPSEGGMNLIWESSVIQVYDQYNHPRKPVGTRDLPFNDSKTDVNNANKFYLIE